jgi:hypothetical protein
MNATEQREKCPVQIGQRFKGGIVTFILGDSMGWGIWVKKYRPGNIIGWEYSVEEYYHVKAR